MSAILGRVRLDGGQVPRSDFMRAFDSLSDWGKDGSRTFVEGSMAVGFHNLALKPVAKYEAQPLWLGCHCIVSDAVIDNRSELCRSLDIDALLADDIPDSRLILAAFMRWGESCVDRLLGDFAFAIWNSETKMLFAARDVVGARPFFYCLRSTTLLFGSTVEAIVSSPDINFSIDESRVAFFLAQPLEPHEDPFIEGVEFLPPGHTLCVSEGGLKVNRYWFPDRLSPAGPMTLDECSGQLRLLIERAIESRVCVTHPTGSHISGGIDSTGVTVLANRLLKRSGSGLDMSYTWAPPINEKYPLVDKDLDERSQIKELCEQEDFGCIFGSASADDFLRFLKRNLALENSADLFEELPLMQNAVSRDTRVMLSGWGGDECVTAKLSGYPSWLLAQRRFSDLFHLARALGGGLRNPVGMCRYVFLYGFLPFCSDGVYSRLSPYFKESRLKRLYSPYFMARHPRALAERRLVWRDAKNPHAAQCSLLVKGHLSARMNLWNTWAGPLGIQYRYPLLDRRLLEFSLSLSPDMLWKKGKSRIVYRHAMQDVLPKRISKYDKANEEKRMKIRCDSWKKMKEDVGYYRRASCPWLDMEALIKKLEEAPGKLEDFELLEFIPLDSAMRVLGLWQQGLPASGISYLNEGDGKESN